MFQQLNAEGITVILVTHDPNVAAYAHRTIHICDGQIENLDAQMLGDKASDPPAAAGVQLNAVSERHTPGDGPPEMLASFSRGAVLTVASPEAPAAGAPARPSLYGDAVPKAQGTTLSSLVPTTLRTALNALRRNKMRSALTALGVIIGVGAVIAMVEIGQGSKAALQKTIASMGANTLLVQSGAAASGGVSFGSGSVLTLTPQDAEEIRQCPAVAEVAPLCRARGPRSSTGTATGYPRRSAARHLPIWRYAIGKSSPKARCSPTATCATAARCA